MNRLSTGSTLLDGLLCGGYETDILTAIYGPASSGKTTMCLMAAVVVAKTGKKVIFVDSEGGFSGERFEQLGSLELLKSVFILKPTNFQMQAKLIESLKSMINEKIGLVVVDTISMLYRVEMGKEKNKHMNNEMSIQLSYLTEITRLNNIPVIQTSQVYSDFEKKDAVKMVGGDLIRYASKCQIELQKHDTQRKAILRTHRSIEENKEVCFKIMEKGIC